MLVKSIVITAAVRGRFWFIFSLTFLKKESEAYEVTSLSIRLSMCPP
jgi:hypothetical protein